MTTSSETLNLGYGKATQPSNTAINSALTLDRWVAILSTIFLAGVYLDGWAHNNTPQLIETFFTPYHALLYGGFFSVATLLIFTLLRNLAGGVAWRAALPSAYFLSLQGIVLFMAGGVSDLVWHETFGFEADVEALLSPTHLLLATGAMLACTGPLRAAWQRKSTGGEGWATLWPALLSLLGVLSVLTFFTQYSTLARPEALISAPYNRDMTFLRSQEGIHLLLTPLLLITGSLLFWLRRWRLPVGGATFLIGINYTLMFVMAWNDSTRSWATLPAVLLAAVVIDLLYVWLRPSAINTTSLRLFAFGVPFLLAAIYIGALLLTQPVWWAIHMWAGVPFLVGAAGLFLSFISNPPNLPEEAA